MRRLAEALGAPDVWQLEVAAMLSQVGCVAVPEAVLAQVYRGGDVAPRELAIAVSLTLNPTSYRGVILSAKRESICSSEPRTQGMAAIPPQFQRLCGTPRPLSSRLNR